VPVDILKVDKSFVDGIGGSSEEAVIATAMIQITRGLHLQAVAEGVETAAQAETLHRLGYRFAQGYHFARPLPPAAIEAQLSLARSCS
jgi:EAL domain-containing protein (putative c-di-GMP-specific phosphodiesterase class I)